MIDSVIFGRSHVARHGNRGDYLNLAGVSDVKWVSNDILGDLAVA